MKTQFTKYLQRLKTMKQKFLLLIAFFLFCSTLFPWSHNVSSPLVICDREEAQNHVQLVRTTDGNFIILWVDERRGKVGGFSWNYKDIYGQKINSSGEILWQEDGMPVVEGQGEGVVFELQTDVKATNDGNGGAIFSWTDASGGGIQENRVRINRIDGSGNKLWGAGGVLLQNGDSGGNGSICSDLQGGAFAVWNYGSFRLWYPRAKASHIGANGNIIVDYGSISSMGGDDGEGSAIANPAVKTSSQGVSIAAWEDARGGPYYGWRSLRVQKFGDGINWALGGVRVSLPNDVQSNIVTYPDSVSDGSGGVIAFWIDSRFGNSNVFAQRVGSSGSALWQDGGICVCYASGNKENLMAVSDNAGGAVCVWVDTRNSTNQIFAQRIDSNGNKLWEEEGVLIGTGSMPYIINSLDGNYLVFWKFSNKIYAQKIDGSGVGWWQEGGVQVNNSNFEEIKVAAETDGAIVVWSDNNIYAQKLFNNGTVDPDSPLVITTEKNLPPAALGKPYKLRIGATGGNGNRYTWQITQGNLPQGISFDQTTGTISGTPAKLGVFNFVASATDGTSVETKLLRLFVQIDTGMEIFSDSDVPGLVKGSSYLLVTRKPIYNSSSIYCQFFDDNGYKIGDQSTVYENYWVDMLDVIYNPLNDKYLIVFMGGSSSNYHLYGIFIDGQTHQAQQPFMINEQPYKYPALSVNTKNGDYLVVVSENKLGGKWIGIMLDKDGQVKTQFDIAQKNYWPRSASVAYNSSENNFLVTYTYSDYEAGYIWGRIIGSDGSVGNENTLARTSQSSLFHNKIVYNPKMNKYLLGYSLYYPPRVLARFINSNGSPSGDAFYISKTDLQEEKANVAVSQSGKMCAFWTDRADEQGNSDYNNDYIYAQQIKETGPAYENDELITPYSGLKKTPVAVLGNTDNNFLVMWKRWEGSSYKVYGIFYNLPKTAGDTNDDEVVDISDVILCLRMAIGIDPADIESADMNGDGIIDISDVILILRKAIGLD